MDAESDTGIEPEIYEDPARGPYWVGLWAVARHWVAVLANIFEPELLAQPGITRRFALRCRNWLWPIEGLLRRLIIAAAMKLDVSQLPKLTARKAPPKPLKRSSAIRFAVLPHPPGRGTQAHAAKPSHSPKPEHRHLGFPGDALLNLFSRHDRRNAPPVSRRSINPLNRRGRRSRWDPDYQCDPVKEQESYNRHFFGPFPQLADRLERQPRRRMRPDRSSPYWRPRGGDGPEWKRLEQEWARVMPAPRLGERIKALVRVLQAPERWIARAARRLSADLLARLRELPPPILKRPKLDRSPSGFLEEPLAQSHALIDTS